MITLAGRWFKDEFGRTVMLRGVNLGGSSKLPMRPYAPTHTLEGFQDHRTVSFVGRPFPLEEADEHFARIKSWGFNFLRFLITWEALEHAGPGIYDEEYLDYLYRVVKKAGDHGLHLYIDPHQDAWSRFTGGDGAPGWTLELAGFDIANLHDSGAALIHAHHGDPFPGLLWFSNYDRLAAATMFSLFFGGNDFAPHARFNGVPAQNFLQQHYINAVCQVARKLKDLPNVLGYGTLNEPSSGMIGKSLTTHNFKLPRGISPTFWEAMQLGAGFPREVSKFGLTLLGFRRTGSVLLNPQRKRAWQADRECVWKEHGVWGLDDRGEPILLRPEHFQVVNGRKVDFYRDYFKPFANRFADAIQAVDKKAIIFVEGIPEDEGVLTWDDADARQVVYAPHWYDGVTMYISNFLGWATIDPQTMRPILGSGNVVRNFIHQLKQLKTRGEQHMGAMPILLGEFGTPFNMNRRRAFRSGDFSQTSRALDASMQAVEANLLHCTLWNYTADNTNDRGDQWNNEDFSIFSRDQMRGNNSIDNGGRSLDAAVRPYPRALPGEPLKVAYDYRRRVFTCEFRHQPGINVPAEFYIPRLHYPHGCRVELSDGIYELDEARQLLKVFPGKELEVHRLQVSPLAG